MATNVSEIIPRSHTEPPSMLERWNRLSGNFTDRRIQWDRIPEPPPIPANQAPIIVNTVMKFTIVHANGAPINLSRLAFDAEGFSYNPARFCANISPGSWPFSTMLSFHGGQGVLRAASFECGVLLALLFVQRLNTLYPDRSPFRILRNSCQTVNVVSKMMFVNQTLNTVAYKQEFYHFFNEKDKFKKTYSINLARKVEGVNKKRTKGKKVVISASERAIVCTGLRNINEEQEIMFWAWALCYPYLVTAAEND